MAILLVGCARQLSPEPVAINAGLHWPDEHVAMIWMTTEAADGSRLQATGTVFVQVWEAQATENGYSPIGLPIHEFAQELDEDSYPEVDAACEPCVLAGNHLIVTLQAIPFNYLEKSPSHSLGLVTVVLRTSDDQVFTDEVPFGFPDGIGQR